MTTDIASQIPLADIAALPHAQLWTTTLAGVNQPLELAREHMHVLGMPTGKEEAWRYSRYAPLGTATFVAGAKPAVDVAITPDLAADQVLINNGWLDLMGVATAHLPGGVFIGRLAQAPAAIQTAALKHWSKILPANTDAFASLNLLRHENTLLIYVPKGVTLSRPVAIYNRVTSTQPLAVFPRILIVAEQSSALTVYERHEGPQDVGYFNGTCVEAFVGENANLDHYYLDTSGMASLSVQHRNTLMQRASNYQFHSLMIGGQLLRMNVTPTMAGPGGVMILNGLYLPSGHRHHDISMRVRHSAEHCDSHQYYSGILQDFSTSAFSGRINVDPGAQKTDAKQTNANLLLSNEARAHTRPQLEIYADDVKCTHGATVGQLDEKTGFYLQARGIPKDIARGMLIYAFASETIGRMRNAELGKLFSRLMLRHLHLGEAIELALTEDYFD